MCLDAPIAENINRMFLDDLLTSYQTLESSFTKNLYQLYKSFEFRSLWDISDKLTGYQRTASEAAPGTGQLQGVIQLDNALQEIDEIENKGMQCFTKFVYNTRVHKWPYDSQKDSTVCIRIDTLYTYV